MIVSKCCQPLATAKVAFAGGSGETSQTLKRYLTLDPTVIKRRVLGVFFSSCTIFIYVLYKLIMIYGFILLFITNKYQKTFNTLILTKYIRKFILVKIQLTKSII